jgi:hypothetical protein
MVEHILLVELTLTSLHLATKQIWQMEHFNLILIKYQVQLIWMALIPVQLQQQLQQLMEISFQVLVSKTDSITWHLYLNNSISFSSF